MRCRELIGDTVGSGLLYANPVTRVLSSSLRSIPSAERPASPLSSMVFGISTCLLSLDDDIAKLIKSVAQESGSLLKGYGFFDVCERIFGSLGVVEAPYSGSMQISGQKPWSMLENAPAKSVSGKCGADRAFTENPCLADSMKDRGFIESIPFGPLNHQIADSASSAQLCAWSKNSRDGTGSDVG